MIAWLKVLFAYWFGRKAGQEAQQQREVQTDDQIAKATGTASVAAPTDRAGVSDELRDGRF